MGDQTSEAEDLENVFVDASKEPIRISYAAIKDITKNFAQEIGHGGFGVVYLGSLKNGMVAVKKLSIPNDFSNKQFLDNQFLEEVTCLKKAKHKNIVRLIGYCVDTQGELMDIEGKLKIVEMPQWVLCFEYVPNGNLHHYIQENTHRYHWNMRYQIFKGICEGLLYLHQEGICHLDLNPANVLLGPGMEPKITDFGLSRFIDKEQATVVTTKVFGTRGFIPPEFIEDKIISFKTDIYGLGVILVYILTGSKSLDKNWHEPLDVSCPQMKCCIEIAISCVDQDRHKRPTMDQILFQLSKTETTTQKISPNTNEPRNDPESSLHQVVQKFHELSTQTIHNKLRFDGIRMELYMLESIVEGRNKPGILPYHLLQLVTDNFSKEHEIGSGDSAVVFKSTLRGVAVKKFISGVGEQMFHREVEISMTSRHPNVLRFFGYCSYAEERLEECNGGSIMTETRERLLCYEYLSNGSLRNHLSTASCGLEWKYRYQIIKGICEGLQYLHGNRIAHLDLRPENILLDDNMVPKLFRFSRSMRFEENQSQNTTTDVMGHLVYMAPEYKYKNQVTLKVDVFSLGVTISEILTGEREYFASNYMFLERTIQRWWNRLGTSASTLLEQVRVCAEISKACWDDDPAKRPDIQRVLGMLLETESMDVLNECRNSGTGTEGP